MDKKQSDPTLAAQHEHIARAVKLLRWQVEQLAQLSYDILTQKPSTPEQWQVFEQRYNLIEHPNNYQEPN